MIEAENINFTINKQSILSDLSFKIYSNKITAILGANGSGKTSLLKCLLGINKLSSGRIILDERPLSQYSIHQLSRKMSYVPQDSYSTINYSVIELLEMSCRHLPKNERNQFAYQVLCDLGFQDLYSKKYKLLSGGQKQIIRIAQAIAQNTPIIVLDEPTNTLDYANQMMILNLCKHLAREGKTIILTSHQPQDVMNFCDNALLLRGGSLYDYDLVERSLTVQTLHAIYGIEVEIDNSITNYPPIILPIMTKSINA